MAQVHNAPSSLAKETDHDYLEGMKVWRSPDKNEVACAFCHTPDAIELACYRFDDENLRRRATPHLGADGAEKIVKFIHAVRKHYGITNLIDPMTDRPLQPGGEVLPGATAEQRDYAFARELETVLPTLAKGSVRSLEAAEKAKDELLALNARTLRVGIPFNRISEDGFHGMEHATFANWFADTALRFHFPWEVYFVMQDAYLRDPSDVNLLHILEFPKMHQAAAYGQYSQLMTNDKYRALLIYQHLLRAKLRGGNAFDAGGPVLLGNLKSGPPPNPLLDLGILTDLRSETPFGQFRFPDDILMKKERGISEKDQLKQIRLPSLYAGWLMDQGLKRSKDDPDERSTRIITERLFADGPYPMHDAFLISKKLITDGFSQEAWSGPGPQHFVPDYSAFLGDGNLVKFEPSNPAERKIYRRFVANSFKMSLYLYKHEADRGAEDEGEEVAAMQSYLREMDPASAGEVEGLVRNLAER